MFSGTPTSDQVGTVALNVIAADAGGLCASCTFNVQVIKTNDAPAVATPLSAQNATRGTAFNYVVPLPGNNAGATATFKDVDEDVEDVLTLSATLANGAALPSSLTSTQRRGRSLARRLFPLAAKPPA